MTLSRDLRRSGLLFRLYARKVFGCWLVDCTTYGADGYYRADLSYTDRPATDRQIDELFDR